MTERCGHCRHWKPPHTRDGFGTVVWVDDDAAPTRTERNAIETAVDLLYGVCGGVPFGPEASVKSVETAPLAATVDASSYQATLYTRAEFGCALWEPSE